MNSYEKLESIITALIKALDAAEAMQASVNRNPLQRYVMGQVVNAIRTANDDLDSYKYKLVTEDHVADIKARHEEEVERLKADANHYQMQAETYFNEHISNMPAVENFPEVVANLKSGAWINAIKEYRTATGCGLKEAKYKIEAARPAFGYVNPS